MEGPWAHYLAHFMGGFMISTVVGHLHGLIIGLTCTIIIAGLKELVDKISSKGTPEVLAAVITSFGGLLAYLILGI